MWTGQLWLQCGLVVQRIPTAHSQQGHATLSPRRQVTWQLQKRACNRGPDLHESRLLRCSNHPAAQAKASTCREIVGPPTRCPGLRRCPGPWQSRGKRRFGLVLVGRVGADSISFVFIFRVCRRIQKAPMSFPVGQQMSRCDGRREGSVNLSGKFGKKRQTLGVFLATPWRSLSVNPRGW